MDVFNLLSQLINDYATYIRSFIKIQDNRIQTHVNEALGRGALWPNPLIQLNPNFAPGAWIDELVNDGILHPLCQKIFQKKEDSKMSQRMRLYRHQTEAIEAAQAGDNYVLTTGTGSGKSLSYIVPIVNHVLHHGSGKGIKAIIIYPMNALANSQHNELEKFLVRGFGKSPVTFERYTGQEGDEKRQEIIQNPPDILLTNYVMLELLLTRPKENDLIKAAKGLQFLVLDELHTYRGRQGADVAMLIRRVRDRCQSQHMQVVGTSATLAEGGTFADQQHAIARVASKLFGATVKPNRVIGETLRRITTQRDLSDAQFQAELTAVLQTATPPTDFDRFIQHPLSTWIETVFGLEEEEENGRLRRATPISITGEGGAAQKLADMTGISVNRCADLLQQWLLAGYDVTHPETNFPVFAFRLHQFIGRGDTVYTSLEPVDERYITLNGQQFVPGHRDKLLLPLAFCRTCGQEYYVVNRIGDNYQFIPREIRDQLSEEDEERGFLYHNPDHPWPDDDMDAMLEKLPEEWQEMGRNGLRVKPYYKKKLPEPITLNPSGQEDPKRLPFYFIKAPFPFCLKCGVSYSGRTRSDFGKLATLSSEGRSTATTILSLSALRTLKRDTALAYKAKKLLSFTDNRQDASLQAGHFNDFVEVGLLRAALYRAVYKAGSNGLEHDELSQAVFDALNLPIELFAQDPNVQFKKKVELERALREVLAYRIYQDLRRGWRVTAPNLEQCGLLQIKYVSLKELCEAHEQWSECHPALKTASAKVRQKVATVLLDLLRRELAIKVDYLDARYQERIQQRSSQRLIDPWAIDEDEKMTQSFIAWPRGKRPRDSRDSYFISPRGGFGMYLRRKNSFPQYEETLKVDDTAEMIPQLLSVLSVAGLVEQVAQDKEGMPAYQMPADAFIWLAGDGTTPFHDPLQMPSLPSEQISSNPFFIQFYKEVAGQLQRMNAKEHTAQVPSEERLEREAAFREGELPLLYCSPTMELGVDISQLNVVNMRNVPPTPANYAQRSGRAGRSGQPALVFTYCTTGSPHDQYFFKRPEQMVSGSVTPPRLDLANESLIRSHVHAVWLAETTQSLHRSLTDLLNMQGDPPPLTLNESVQQTLQAPGVYKRSEARLQKILESIQADLAEAYWYDETWLHRTLVSAVDEFDRACQRWRELYTAALAQQQAQHEIMRDASRSPQDKKIAARLRREAEAQLALLTNANSAMYSDFYSYRYFASEGFLPGYNFPRLPLSAYIPARRKKRDDYLSRPRFLAISEFGPRSIIYHEGSRYVINRVILPVSEEIDEQGLPTVSAKLCPMCGYLHPSHDQGESFDLCQRCHSSLTGENVLLTSLFRMTNVQTRRRDRINSDEEERMRLGYNLRTGVRLPPNSVRQAQLLSADGEPLFKLTYGDTATIWRINLGWRRSKQDSPNGFLLDTERGYWEKNSNELDPDPDDATSDAKKRVIPFVEDTRNCLLIEPTEKMETAVMASLQPALKTAIQVLYQLEDNELAAEPLPSIDDRNLILLYESSEGGAGVLRQLLDDPHAMAQVAQTALALCHFTEEGSDLGHAVGASERCEAACYDCLLSYYNQRDHRMVDRHLIVDILLSLTQSHIQISPSNRTRADHLAWLKKQCDSQLEQAWLDMLETHQFHLPEKAQVLFEDCQTRVDFYYEDRNTVIFIDGPHHDALDIIDKDRQIDDCLGLFGLGKTVLRFRHDNIEQWADMCAQQARVFGQGASA